jgi:demethylmacrocin O-methyltransferase
MKTLVELFETGLYDTDKGSDHNYLRDYDKLFYPYRDRKINVFEVGFYHGGSCKLWEDYFYKAKIKFADIDPDCVFDSVSGRATLDIIDSMTLTPKYFKNFPPDIAIDDSFHSLESQIHFIKTVYPALRPGGLLIIEDVISLEMFKPAFDELDIPYEIIDRRIEQNRTDEVLLIFRK